MLISILVAAASAGQQAPPIDSIYTTPAVRAIVERAALHNAAPPAALSTYSARVETEVLLTLTDAEKRETVLQIEQFASDLFWQRDGGLAQQVIGYRAQMGGVNISALTFLRVPYVVPTLFADRLDFIRFRNPPRNDSGQVRQPRTLHPLADTRDQVYHFSGGDTVTIQLPDRALPIVRVHVEPVHQPERPTLVFDGDIDIDAERHHIVRMEGRLLLSPGRLPLLDPFLKGALYVRLENGEYDQQYWLPREQRFEIQSMIHAGERRAVMRGVSRFVALVPNDSLAHARVADPDSFPWGRMVRGEAGEISHYDGWRHPIGTISDGLTAYDFETYAPNAIRPSHGSYLGFSVRDVSNVLRINPIEGVFTGGGVIYHLDGNNTVRAHAGYAWSEETVRGGAEYSHRVGRWDFRARAERVLAFNDDFTSALNRTPGVVPVLASGNHRFIDRRLASLGVRVPPLKRLVLRVDAGRASDRNVQRHHGLAQIGDTIFRNRATAGDYWFLRTELHHNPAARQGSLQPGLSWRVRYDGARGDFRWHRIDGAIGGRRHLGNWTFSSSIDGGTTLGAEPPPQAQFTLGDPDAVPGYENTNFIARRALAAGVRVRYTLPLLRSPIRIGRFYLPAIAPAPTMGVHFGWAEVDQNDSAEFDSTWDGVARAGIHFGLHFFGGSVMVGVARPLGRHGPWRPLYTGGF
jgi:hypothetical protein